MGLPKPLGPFGVAFADFELRRRSHPQFSAADEAATAVPPMRIFYPTLEQPKWWRDASHRRWLMGITYAYGYLQNFILSSTTPRRIILWILAGIVYIVMWPGTTLAASVSSPILQLGEGSDKRLPVLIFSHGMWACRTTYSAFCCDLASHGYIVVALEHLDGSSNATRCSDENGKKKWVPHAFSNVSFGNVPMEDRSKQLRQRTDEVQKVINVLEDLDGGRITQDKNVISGKLGLDVSKFQNRFNLSNLTIIGHSFGGATAITACGRDGRLRCCIGLDVWWEPVEKVDYERIAGKVPLLLLNTETFDWKSLSDARKLFLNLRAAANTVQDPLLTELVTIKGTHHQDQCDLPLILPVLSKKIGLSGTLDCKVTKDTNSWMCLDFLQRNLMRYGGYKPLKMVEEPSFARGNLVFST